MGKKTTLAIILALLIGYAVAYFIPPSTIITLLTNLTDVGPEKIIDLGVTPTVTVEGLDKNSERYLNKTVRTAGILTVDFMAPRLLDDYNVKYYLRDEEGHRIPLIYLPDEKTRSYEIGEEYAVEGRIIDVKARPFLRAETIILRVLEPTSMVRQE